MFKKILFGCFDVSGFSGREIKRSTATDKNVKIVIIVFAKALKMSQSCQMFG